MSRVSLLAALLVVLLAAASPAGAQGLLRPGDQGVPDTPSGFPAGPGGAPADGAGGGTSGGATTAADPLQEVVDALDTDPLYVADDPAEPVGDREAADLRRRIDRANAGPVYIAFLSSRQLAAAGGDEGAALREIAIAGAQAGREGVYAVVGDGAFRAGAIGQTRFADGAVPQVANDAVEIRGGEGAVPVVREFLQQLGQTAANGGDVPAEAPVGGLAVLGVIAVGGGAFALSRSRRRRREESEHAAELAETAREDLVALGDDIRALDLDVEMPGADQQAKDQYAVAVERYDQAERALDRAKRPEDFAEIAEALEEGRFAMSVAKARFAGLPAPERRPPCFFDPRHGPSVTEVDWAPAGGQPRPVPVCQADAVRIESGEEPMTREVLAGGRRVPLYDAPAYYSPYAGGFFGGFSGFLPGLLFGSVLSSALTPGPFIGGGFGGYESGGGGDSGGGFDLGDFGGGGFGGGGDFGGGDFGGGDF
jgi:hypothetical protein